MDIRVQANHDLNERKQRDEGEI